MNLRPIVLLLATTLCGAMVTRAPAVEPEVDPKQLPRVPPTEPARALSTFRIKPGFRLELVAAEPLVVDPIALSFDEDGRLYVIEMRDYSERRPARLGRVRLLEDGDGDGRFEKSTIFARDLPWPTAVICWGGGVFVGATPDLLYFKDTDGDGVADVRETIFTGFASDYAPFETNRLNVQALMNSFHWGLDNRIHGATSFSGGKVRLADSPFTRKWLERAGRNPQSAFRIPPSLDLRGRDFSFDPRTLEMRAESGGGQHGMSFDNRGRKFVCSNSDHIQLIMYEDRYAARNPAWPLPNPRVSIAADGPAAEVYRISPDEPWRVLRTQWRVAGLVSGPIEGGGRPSGYFTGATGVTIYRGDAYGEEFVGDAFIGDAGGNLVHRKKLRPDGLLLRAERPADEQKVEFLASTDNWFRPVQFANGPDGCLYLADMYREVIEHPWSLPANLKKHLDLNSGHDRGRIYRLVPERFQQLPPPRLSQTNALSLVKLLEHPNGWHRDTAARLLQERQDKSVTPSLAQMIVPRHPAHAVVHALHALAGLGALTEENVRSAVGHDQATVHEHALKLAEPFLARPSPELLRALRRLAKHRDPDDTPCDLQFAFALAALESPARTELYREFLKKRETIQAGQSDSHWIDPVVLGGIGNDALALFSAEANSREAPRGSRLTLLANLARVIGRRNDSNEVARVLAFATNVVSAPGGIDVRSNPGLASEIAAALEDGLKRSGATLHRPSTEPAMNWFYDAIRPIALGIAQGHGEPTRVATIKALATAAPYGSVRRDVADLLRGGTNSPGIQQAAVTALGSFVDPSVGSDLVALWPYLSPVARGDAILALLKRQERVRSLLAAIENGAVPPGALSLTQQGQLRSHRDAAIREQATKVLGRSAPPARQSALANFQRALALRGDAAKGRGIFQARCASCHQLHGDGYALGPDLATVKAGGREKLLTAILDPNREVAPNFLSYSVETQDGDSFTGIVTSESGVSVTLRQPNGLETVLLRSKLASMRGLGLSLMPEGLEEGLRVQDVADLLEFILAP